MPEPGKKKIETPDGLVEYEVTLGRDQSKRPFKFSATVGSRQYMCMCCTGFTLNGVDYCEICKICGWEDWYECHDNPKVRIPPNYISLHQAQELLATFGATAMSNVNRYGGITVDQLHKMTKDEIAQLKSPSERVAEMFNRNKGK